MKLSISIVVVTLLCSGPLTLANEQCRFIDKRIEREGCYARQDAERSAKAKDAETKKRAVIVTPPLDESDRAMFRTLHSICRGC